MKSPQIVFAIGAVAGWGVASVICGRRLPALSLPTIIAVFVGGTIATVVGFTIAAGKKEDSEKNKGGEDRQGRLF